MMNLRPRLPEWEIHHSATPAYRMRDLFFVVRRNEGFPNVYNAIRNKKPQPITRIMSDEYTYEVWKNEKKEKLS